MSEANSEALRLPQRVTQSPGDDSLPVITKPGLDDDGGEGGGTDTGGNTGGKGGLDEDD